MLKVTDYPHLTIAAVAERDGKFLFVREETEEGIVLNQPAGHVEPGEDMLDAVVRETMEETAWKVEPLAFLGISQYTSSINGITYVRHTFSVRALYQCDDVVLDDGIIEALWLSPEEAFRMALRSPLVVHSVHSFLRGTHYPLTLYHHI